MLSVSVLTVAQGEGHEAACKLGCGFAAFRRNEEDVAAKKS